MLFSAMEDKRIVVRMHFERGLTGAQKCLSDFNPLDYFIWGALEAKVNAQQHRSWKREWGKLSMDLVHASIESWRDRLSLAVRHRGGRFE